jgi:hypothetical protein
VYGSTIGLEHEVNARVWEYLRAVGLAAAQVPRHEPVDVDEPSQIGGRPPAFEREHRADRLGVQDAAGGHGVGFFLDPGRAGA